MVHRQIEQLITTDTLVALLRERAMAQGSQRAYTIVVDDVTEVAVSYAELDRRARIVAARLQALGATGERALLLYQPGFDYIVGFLGCLYAGVVAVPAYPPNPARLGRTLPRLQAIAANAGARFALTTGAILSLASMVFEVASDLGALTWLATDSADLADADAWQPTPIGQETLAFLQYTSGSTGVPKGVMLTHGNLLANLAVIKDAFQLTAHDVGVSWLPPYHDMGLIGGILQPIYAGLPCVLLSPLDFLQRPMRWLRAITRHQATVSGGPNFAYELCARKVTPAQLAELDLSSWRVAFNGAEPVRAAVLDSFASSFAACGFRPEASYPCYGLAEGTLIVSGGDPAREPARITLSARALEANRAVPTEPDASDSVTLVSAGAPRPSVELAVVDPASQARCRPGAVGEIWLAGPSVAQGYWDRPAETAELFGARIAGEQGGPFLRTGDLGFVLDGELYVTGRLKDLIIVDGRNHYPQDIEQSVEQSHAAIRPGCSAAFAIERGGQERLVVVAEIDRHAWTALAADGSAGMQALRAAVRQAVAENHDLRLHDFVPLKSSSIPKTSSGKIQRHACKAGYLDGSLEQLEA
jgi:acyl-CoA synthetase (AMP-forming)/AMP-acid ligase II